MPDIGTLLSGGQAAEWAKDPRLEQLKDAPETQRLFQLLGKSTGDLEQAAQQAARGDTGALMGAIGQLMRDPEGQKLMAQLRQKLN